MATRQFCTFHVGSCYFGVKVERVQEVIRYQEMTRVPLASKVVTGLINLRGQIVTALDLRERLGLPERPDGMRPMNVVVRADDGALSFLVDQIGDVVDVDEDEFEKPPETLHGIACDLIDGAFKLKDCLLLVLNIDRAANLATH